MGSKQGFCCVPLAFAFCVHAAKTTEPILALARWSLQFSSIIPCRKAEKHKYFLIFLPPVLLFATGRATVPRSSGQIELCIHAIQFCTPRSNRQCAPTEKYPSASTSGFTIFIQIKTSHLFPWFISTLEF